MGGLQLKLFYAVRKFLWDIFRGFVLRIAILTMTIAMAAVGLEAWFWFRLPPIIRGLPSGFFRHGVPNMEGAYKERVKSAFPIGMAEADLIRDLQGQGFSGPFPSRGKKYAIFEEGFFPCLNSWSVVWRADESGAASEVKGELGKSCL